MKRAGYAATAFSLPVCFGGQLESGSRRMKDGPQLMTVKGKLFGKERKLRKRRAFFLFQSGSKLSGVIKRNVRKAGSELF